MPRSPRTLASALVALALLAGLVFWVGPGRVAEAARTADGRLALVALLCYATFFALRGLRWALLLRPFAPRASAVHATHATAVGWLANNLLPMRAGEVVRAGLVSRREAAPFPAVFSTVAVERVLDVAGLVGAAAISLAFLPAGTLPAWAVIGLRIAAALATLAVGALVLGALARGPVTRLVERCSRPLPGKLQAKVLATFGHLVDGAEPVVRRPALLAAALPLTLAMTVAQCGIYAFLLKAFLPDVPLLAGFAGAPWFILTFAVSFTPGNIGTYEAAFAAVYASLGVPAESALAAAVLTHLATFLSVVLFGCASLAALGAGARGDILGAARRRAEA